MDYFIVIILILISAFFSGSTLGFFSLNRGDLERKAKLGDKKAKKVYNLRKNGNLLLCTLLIGNVAVNAAISIYLGSIVSGVLAGIMATILIVIFGEIFPMLSARKHPDATALKNAILLRASSYIFYPLILFVSGVSRLINVILRNKAGTFGDITRDELLIIFNGRYEKANKMTRKVVQDALRIKELTALDVMIHLNDVKAVSEDMSVSELEEMILSSQYSRFPVYSDSIFNIVSTIHVTSILSASPSESIKLYSATNR